MKKIKLTQNKFTLVDDEDFDKLNQYKWRANIFKYTSYAVREGKKRIHISMHREIINCPKNLQVDHINKNGLDNRKENLRICNKSQNQGNRKLNKNNKSNIRGVYWNKLKKKWVSQIITNGKRKHLGYFINKNDAKKIYEKEAKKHFKEFYSEGI